MPSILLNEPLLDEKLAQLEEARSWSSRVISKLETTIRTADDYALFRVNPLQYAKERGMAENEAIDLFLHATKFGLFEMNWHLVCPFCAHVVESFKDLGKVHSHFVCNLCSAESTVALDDYIQISFTLSPHVRELAFHHPETLSIEDYYLKYHLSKGVAPMPDGRSFADLLLTFTKARAYFAPHEKKAVEFDVLPGVLHARDLGNKTGATFFVTESESAGAQTIPFQLQEGKLRPIDMTMPPQEMKLGPGTFKFEQVGQLDSGKVVVEIENLMDKTCPLWIIHFPANLVPVRQEFEPFLSGKRLLTTQTFRDLFRFEAAPGAEGIGVKEITFLFTDLKGSTAMYDQIGDPQAFFLVRQHFDTLGRVVAGHSGAIVKMIGDAVMATFMTPLDGVNAAVEMLNEIETFNQGISAPLILKIGVHTGHSIAVTLNDRLDYFGQTVNIAARVQGLAEADEIYITRDVYTHPGVPDALAGYAVQPEQAAMKGVSEKMGYTRLRCKTRRIPDG